MNSLGLISIYTKFLASKVYLFQTYMQISHLTTLGENGVAYTRSTKKQMQTTPINSCLVTRETGSVARRNSFLSG